MLTAAETSHPWETEPVVQKFSENFIPTWAITKIMFRKIFSHSHELREGYM
jgi:hypothetical protein